MKRLIFALILSALWTNAHAIPVSLTGNFADDDSRLNTTFNITSTSTVNLTSLGYAGGVNAEGTVIPDGGFDTQLFLFDSSGALVDNNDDGAGAPVSVSSGRAYDALLSLSLVADTYTAVLTQYNNDYTSGDLFADSSWNGSGRTNFVDFSGSQRTSAYALDITVTSDVPEPSILALLGLGLAGIGFSRRKKTA